MRLQLGKYISTSPYGLISSADIINAENIARIYIQKHGNGIPIALYTFSLDYQLSSSLHFHLEKINLQSQTVYKMLALTEEEIFAHWREIIEPNSIFVVRICSTCNASNTAGL